LVFKVNHPRKTTKFFLQGYDRDFFSSNEMFGEASLSLGELMEDVALIKKPLGINKTYYDEVLKEKYPDVKMDFDKENPSKFFITLHGKDKKGKLIKRGKVNVTADVLP